MFIRKLVCLFVVSVCLVGSTFAQSLDLTQIAIVPLTVPQGFPLQVALTHIAHFKIGEPVEGKLAQPIYAFDRQVVPAGVKVMGHLTGFRSRGKWKRLASMLSGDFTPAKQPEFAFEAIELADGMRIPIETSVTSRSALLVRYHNGKSRTYAPQNDESGNNVLHSLLWSASPFRPQELPLGATYEVTLQKPVEFGTSLVRKETYAAIGSQPASGSHIYARLLTSVDSRTAVAGALIQAELTYPLFSTDHRLIFPVGSTLYGEVSYTRAAARMRQGGELSLKFTKIEAPLSFFPSVTGPRSIEGRLVSIQPAQYPPDLGINGEGVATIARSKSRFLAPALSAVGAIPVAGAHASSFGGAFVNAYTGSVLNRVVGGDAGFGLPLGIAGAMVPPLGMGLGAYAVGHAVYANIFKKGGEIKLPVNTPIELEVDTR